MLTVLGTASLLIWVYLLLARGGFWRIRRFLIPAPGLPPQQAKTALAGDARLEALPARVAVVIPARDEAGVVDRSIASLLNQTGGHSVHIVLVDDASSDGTADVARNAARAAGKLDQLIVSQGRPLMPGWSGKLWAVQQGVELARNLNPDFILLTDADIVHAPDSVAALVAMAQSGPLDLVSVMVKLHCRTFAEKLLIPAFVFFFFKLYPLAWIANPRRGIAAAAGGSILIRPESLDSAGGIAAIRGEVIDDCALARKVKQSGGRLWLGLSATTESIRPYGGFAEIGRMISRGAFNQLRHSAWMLLLALMGLCVTYLLPPSLLCFSHRPGLVFLGAAAWLLMFMCFLPTIHFYRLSPLWAVALPVTSIFYMGATVHSALCYWSGRGGQWKGRVQDPATGRG